jgi:16S rRNA (cytidine1402-2'-O)-methyltransferase
MLSIVSTPIGNLGDITLRALETLKTCDAVICEDTRVTGQLFSLLQLPKKEFISFHGYTDAGKADWIVERLQKGEHLVLVSDAGTPCISDPGYLVVSKVRDAGLKMEVLPGASAFLAALSASGLPIDQFTYLGFLPVKKGRQTLFLSLKEEERTVVFYESPHRILKTLSEFSTIFADQPQRKITICRELTKLHEEVIHTTIGELAERITSLTVKGEFAVVLGPKE